MRAKKRLFLAGMVAALCAFLTGVWFVAPGLLRPTRTDQIGQIRVTVPESWRSLRVNGSLVFLTSCEHLGISELTSPQSPVMALWRLKPDMTDAPLAGPGWAISPTDEMEVKQAHRGALALILWDNTDCENSNGAVRAAIASIR